MLQNAFSVLEKHQNKVPVLKNIMEVILKYKKIRKLLTIPTMIEYIEKEVTANREFLTKSLFQIIVTLPEINVANLETLIEKLLADQDTVLQNQVVSEIMNICCPTKIQDEEQSDDDDDFLSQFSSSSTDGKDSQSQ